MDTSNPSDGTASLRRGSIGVIVLLFAMAVTAGSLTLSTRNLLGGVPTAAASCSPPRHTWTFPSPGSSSLARDTAWIVVRGQSPELRLASGARPVVPTQNERFQWSPDRASRSPGDFTVLRPDRLLDPVTSYQVVDRDGGVVVGTYRTGTSTHAQAPTLRSVDNPEIRPSPPYCPFIDTFSARLTSLEPSSHEFLVGLWVGDAPATFPPDVLVVPRRGSGAKEWVIETGGSSCSDDALLTIPKAPTRLTVAPIGASLRVGEPRVAWISAGAPSGQPTNAEPAPVTVPVPAKGAGCGGCIAHATPSEQTPSTWVLLTLGALMATRLRRQPGSS